ncbi:PREDICTED: uncharacterized protein LOC109221957, partial [Nicotiana attenuata]|uniref:uncharacterized protein LOC109221957 n=1 Tax=Nicotiana attenuata TaxID=49451 RepID=UPI00090525F4
MPESSYRPPAIQGPSGEHSKSSYRPPSIQGSSGGYPGQQAQTSRYQASVPRGCYECGDPGHIKRTCPRLRGKAVQQGQQSMDPAPAAQPSRGGGQTGRGRPTGGGQMGRGQLATTRTGGGQTAGAPFVLVRLRVEGVGLVLDIGRVLRSE